MIHEVFLAQNQLFPIFDESKLRLVLCKSYMRHFDDAYTVICTNST